MTKAIWVHAALTLLASAVILWASSFPIPILVLPLVLVLGLPMWVWYIRLIRKPRSPAADRRPRARIVAWGLLPACTIAISILLATRLPFQWRFAASRAAMEQHAGVMLSRPPEEGMEWGDRRRFFSTWRLGAYTVNAIDVDYPRRHVYFMIGHGIRPNGLAYVGDSAVPADDAWREAYLPTRWWLFAAP